jgi:hypothetical protein
MSASIRATTSVASSSENGDAGRGEGSSLSLEVCDRAMVDDVVVEVPLLATVVLVVAAEMVGLVTVDVVVAGRTVVVVVLVVVVGGTTAPVTLVMNDDPAHVSEGADQLDPPSVDLSAVNTGVGLTSVVGDEAHFHPTVPPKLPVSTTK